jgi:ABC-type sulfate/molybdate transport systems ATPase subunit
MPFLQVSGISRREAGTDILRDISFTQPAVQKLAIAGATGSGKTTLLKLIAGLVQPDAGSVFFEGERVIGPDEKLMPGHAGIAYLSQHFELLNRYRVKEVLEMANQLSVEEAALIYNVCRIDHLLERWTHQVSGGERQRIALARLLVSAPKLLLLDEPYSNLDAIHKSILKSVIDGVSEQLNITCILVAHDPVDLLSWADKILVLRNGQIIQKGTPAHIYQQPLNEYAAALFGKFNLLSPALAKGFARFADLELNQISRFIRPSQFKIVSGEHDGLKGEVVKVAFMGTHLEMEVIILGHPVIISTAKNNLKKGDCVYVAL